VSSCVALRPPSWTFNRSQMHMSRYEPVSKDSPLLSFYSPFLVAFPGTNGARNGGFLKHSSASFRMSKVRGMFLMVVIV
jgi:hypothetical protein